MTKIEHSTPNHDDLHENPGDLREKPDSPHHNPDELREKILLMISFFGANMADLLITLFAIYGLGFQEVNPIAKELFEQSRLADVAALKLALTSALILLFALGNDSDSRFNFSYEKSLKFGRTIVWLIVIFNALQVMAELVS
jgi:magnesium-transporting ATPase (P-type)